MSIFHITHTDPNHDSRILKEVNGLCDNFHAHQILVFGIYREPLPEVLAYNKNVVVFNTKLATRNLLLFSLKLKHLIIYLEFLLKCISKLIRYRPSIIHCHDTTALSIGYFYSLFSDASLIYDAHELESDKNNQHKVIGYFVYLFEKIAFFRINLLITVSTSIDSWYKSHFCVNKSVVVLNSPSVENKCSTSTSNSFNDNFYLNKKFNINNDEKIFIYVGMLMGGRGIDLILEVFESKSINSHIVFVGEGVLESKIKHYASKNKNIHLHNKVKHDVLVKLIQSADVGICLIENVSLSDYYSLPNKLFEYSFAGLRIIGSNFPEIKSIIEGYNLGLCCDHNFDELSSCVQLISSTNINSNNYEINSLSWMSQLNILIQSYPKMTNQTERI